MNEIINKNKHISKRKTKERNRGRQENRLICTYQANEKIKQHWPGAQTIINVTRTRITQKGGTTITTSYYLSSITKSAKEFLKGIRHHWGIENRLHYVKDVTLKEDESKIKKGNAPEILSLIRNLIINLVRINGDNRIKKFMRNYAGNIALIASILE